MSDLLIVGVDPGHSGAGAVLYNGELVEVFDLPALSVTSGRRTVLRLSPHLLAQTLRTALAKHRGDDPFAGPKTLAFVEQVSAMPKQGVASSFAFGEASGIAKGVLAALGLALHPIPATEWKRITRVGSSKDDGLRLAIQRWPRFQHQFSLKKHHNRADAALIALAGHLKETANG